jgi:hypothetical protein
MSWVPPAYNDTNFRAQFPAFANTTAFPEVALSATWTTGTAYISPNANPGWTTNPAQLQRALDLMCAHLTQLAQQIANGTPMGVMSAASEGSVSITLQPPPVKSAFSYWLSTTVYGAELRMLLDIVGGVGFYVGGSCEREGFRKAGGVF